MNCDACSCSSIIEHTTLMFKRKPPCMNTAVASQVINDNFANCDPYNAYLCSEQRYINK